MDYFTAPYSAPEPPEPKRSSRIGCLPLMAAVALVVLVVLWGTGYLDRIVYESALQRAGESTVSTSVEEKAEQAPLHYAYSQLNDEDQKKYRIVLAALETREDQPYPNDDIDDLDRIHQCVQADHPELFYVDGVSMETVTNQGSGLVERVSVRGRFAYSEEDAQAVAAQVESAATRCLEGLPDGADDYTVSKYLYEWLAENVTYDYEAAASSGGRGEGAHSTAQTVEGPLLEGSAVCGGYATSYQLLMQKVGLQCTFVTGWGNDGLHAWCLSLLDGAYYLVDPTWADPQSGDAGLDFGYVNYDYLNVTADRFNRTHEPTVPFALPPCVDDRANYYVREDLLFSDADEMRLGMLASNAVIWDAPLQVCCADEGVYVQLRDNFVANGRISSYLPRSSYRYSCSDANYSILVMG